MIRSLNLLSLLVLNNKLDDLPGESDDTGNIITTESSAIDKGPKVKQAFR